MSSGSELSGDIWGWIVAIGATTWGIVLRLIIGKYTAASKAERELKAAINIRLTAIETRLTVIESRSHNKRKGD